MSAAFRIEVLSAVPGMSQRAVERLSKKLDEAAESKASVEIGEEMRHLTLQVKRGVFLKVLFIRWSYICLRCTCAEVYRGGGGGGGGGGCVRLVRAPEMLASRRVAAGSENVVRHLPNAAGDAHARHVRCL